MPVARSDSSLPARRLNRKVRIVDNALGPASVSSNAVCGWLPVMPTIRPKPSLWPFSAFELEAERGKSSERASAALKFVISGKGH